MSSKVFVGNLSFKTREPDLAKAFEDVCGKVKSTNIIARGPRSLGYGFVEFEKAEDAAKSIALMNKKEIDGRPVNVELARPRAELPPGGAPQQMGQPMGQRPPRRTGRFMPRRYNQPMMSNAPQQGVQQQVQQPQQQGVQQPQQQSFQQPQQQSFQPQQQSFQRAPRRYPPRSQMPPQQGMQQVQQPLQSQQPQQGGMIHNFRPRFQRRPPMHRNPRPTGELSKTTLFVANLPFIVDDSGLLEIFEGMNVKEAHVVTRKDGRSKGYGFVTFDNEADQLHAMQTVDKSLVESREISVHQAFAQPPVIVQPTTGTTTTTQAPKQPATTTTTPAVVPTTTPATTAQVPETKAPEVKATPEVKPTTEQPKTN